VQSLTKSARPLIPTKHTHFFKNKIPTEMGVHLHGNRIVLGLAPAASPTSGSDRMAKVQEALTNGKDLNRRVARRRLRKMDGMLRGR
jgi:hypothetical protein